MKPTKLILQEMTFKNGVRLNELQLQGLIPHIDKIIKESYNEGYDNAINDILTWDGKLTKEDIINLKKK